MIWCCTKQSLSGKPARRACAQIARHSPNRSGLRHSHPALRPVDAVARRRLRPARFRLLPPGCLRSGKKNRPRSQLKIFCTKIEPPKSMAARKTNPISARSHRRFFVLFPQSIAWNAPNTTPPSTICSTPACRFPRPTFPLPRAKGP